MLGRDNPFSTCLATGCYGPFSIKFSKNVSNNGLRIDSSGLPLAERVGRLHAKAPNIVLLSESPFDAAVKQTALSEAGSNLLRRRLWSTVSFPLAAF